MRPIQPGDWIASSTIRNICGIAAPLTVAFFVAVILLNAAIPVGARLPAVVLLLLKFMLAIGAFGTAVLQIAMLYFTCQKHRIDSIGGIILVLLLISTPFFAPRYYFFHFRHAVRGCSAELAH